MRERLPSRRHAIHEPILWPPNDGKEITVTAGLNDAGEVREVFLSGGGQIGSERGFILSDAAVCLSILLQHNVTLDEIAHSLARDEETGAPASMIGAAVETLRRIQAEVAEPK